MALTAFATVQDMQDLWRTMTAAEQARATVLLLAVSNRLRQQAKAAGMNLDDLAAADEVYAAVLKTVTVDVAARAMNTPTDEVPMSQMSQSALGYTVSGTYLVPGGGIFIKRDELKLLGIRRQRIGAAEYDFN